MEPIQPRQTDWLPHPESQRQLLIFRNPQTDDFTVTMRHLTGQQPRILSNLWQEHRFLCDGAFDLIDPWKGSNGNGE